MNRRITVLLLLCCLTLCLASCKEEDHSKEAKETATAFLEAVKNGEFNKASSYCSTEEAASLGWETYSEQATDEFSSSISGEGVGSSDYKPSDAVTSIISSWVDQLCGEMITGYTISDKITHNKQVYTVPADITYHNSDSLSDDISESTKNYLEGDISKLLTEEKMNELTTIYLQEGQDAMLDKLFELILPDLLDNITKVYTSSPTVTDTITLTVENLDGDWVITKDDGKLKGITSLGSGAQDAGEPSTEAGTSTMADTPETSTAAGSPETSTAAQVD